MGINILAIAAAISTFLVVFPVVVNLGMPWVNGEY